MGYPFSKIEILKSALVSVLLNYENRRSQARVFAPVISEYNKKFGEALMDFVQVNKG